MAVATLVTLEEYLSTSYRPDREFVDGRLIERNVGEFNHSFLQGAIWEMLKNFGLRAYVELRFQVRQNSFRIPDVLALAPGQKRAARYLAEPPYIVVEVLSPEDRVSALTESLSDYFEKGVPNVWVVDPEAQTLTVHEPGKARIVRDRVETHDGAVSLDVADLFRRMAEDGE